jgi:hypothetical protein
MRVAQGKVKPTKQREARKVGETFNFQLSTLNIEHPTWLAPKSFERGALDVFFFPHEGQGISPPGFGRAG